MNLRARTLIAMVASFVVTVPIGYAVADDAGSDQPAAPVPADIADPAPAASAHPDAQTYLSPPTPELVDTCRERLTERPDDQLCNAILLVNDGELNPGPYTNAEFNEAYDQAMSAAAQR